MAGSEDLTTQLPPVPATRFVVEVRVDPEWYAGQDSPDPLPAAGPARVVPVAGSRLLVGRRGAQTAPGPDVDCGADSGVSRRQAVLTRAGSTWWVEDLGSANGTFVGSAGGTLPETPLPPGRAYDLGEDDCVYVGSWTRLQVREVPDEEEHVDA